MLLCCGASLLILSSLTYYLSVPKHHHCRKTTTAPSPVFRYRRHRQGDRASPPSRCVSRQPEYLCHCNLKAEAKGPKAANMMEEDADIAGFMREVKSHQVQLSGFEPRSLHQGLMQSSCNFAKAWRSIKGLSHPNNSRFTVEEEQQLRSGTQASQTFFIN